MTATTWENSGGDPINDLINSTRDLQTWTLKIFFSSYNNRSWNKKKNKIKFFEVKKMID